MATRSFTSADHTHAVRASGFPGSSTHRARRRPLTKRVVVMGRSTADAVRWAGGWLCDSSMAGADVLVLVPDGGETRPLRILGAHGADFEAAITSRERGPRPHVLAVDSVLCEIDPRVHRFVRHLLGHGLTEIRLWGGEWCDNGTDTETDSDVLAGTVRHRLSVAARAFKTEALAAVAAAAPDPFLGETEVFAPGDLLPDPPAAAVAPVA